MLQNSATSPSCKPLCVKFIREKIKPFKIKTVYNENSMNEIFKNVVYEIIGTIVIVVFIV